MGSLLSLPASNVPRIHFSSKPAFLPVKSANGSEVGKGEGVVEEESLDAFIEARCPSLRKEFNPAWWLYSGHLQTGWCVFGDFTKIDKVVYERKTFRLTDGGTLGLDFTPAFEEQRHCKEDTPVIVVTHGLTGGSYESYVRTILAPACTPVEQGGLGYRAVVVNFRGCAGVPITSPQLYSAGHTDDLRQALIYIANLYPKAPLLGIGYSLGANVLVKYLAEEGKNSRLSSGCAIGCPWNLNANNDALNNSFLHRNVYAKGMGTNLVNLVRMHQSSMSKFTERNLARQVPICLSLKSPTLEDFDNAMTRFVGGSTAPHGPFPLARAKDYYTWASTHEIVADVRVPLLAINAADDPIVQDVPMSAGDNPWAAMVLTARGGHLGWFEAVGMHGEVDRWIRKPVLEWLRAVGDDLVHEPRGSRIYEEDGYLKEEGRAHLGLQEQESGGILQSAVGGQGMLKGL